MLQIVENHILEQITIVIKEISDITNRKILFQMNWYEFFNIKVQLTESNNKLILLGTN